MPRTERTLVKTQNATLKKTAVAKPNKYALREKREHSIPRVIQLFLKPAVNFYIIPRDIL